MKVKLPEQEQRIPCMCLQKHEKYLLHSQSTFIAPLVEIALNDIPVKNVHKQQKETFLFFSFFKQGA